MDSGTRIPADIRCWKIPWKSRIIRRAGIAPRRRKEKGRDMADRQYLQDQFLNTIRKTKNPVTVFLVNGVKLQGMITSFDNFCVLLRRDGASQLVYKHAISTIMPANPVSLHPGSSDSGASGDGKDEGVEETG